VNADYCLETLQAHAKSSKIPPVILWFQGVIWARPKNSNWKPEVSYQMPPLAFFDPWGLVFVGNLLNTSLLSSNTLKIVLNKIIRLPNGIQLWWQGVLNCIMHPTMSQVWANTPGGWVWQCHILSFPGPLIIGAEAWCKKSKFGPFGPDEFIKFPSNSSRWNQANIQNPNFCPDYASGYQNLKNCLDQPIRPQKRPQESGWHSKSLLD